MKKNFLHKQKPKVVKETHERLQSTCYREEAGVTKAENNNDISKSARNSAKEIDTNGNKRRESKKNTTLKGESMKVSSRRSKTVTSENASSFKELEANYN